MKKQRYRYLATAVALATSFAVLPGMASAAETVETAVAEKDAGKAVAGEVYGAENAVSEAPAGGTGEVPAAAANPPSEETAPASGTGEIRPDEAAGTAVDTVAPEAEGTPVPEEPGQEQPGPEEPGQEKSGPEESAADASRDSGGDAAKAANERAREWNRNRPQEDNITATLSQYEGKTIVDTVIEGASPVTEGTAKAATVMKPGDTFQTKGLLEDRDNIYNTGYFYDIYPSFEIVPEGVVLTYHVLENPVLKSITIVGNTVETDKDLYDLVTVKTNEILNSRRLHENVQAIQDKYSRDGYILAKITDMNIDDDGNLVLAINEGMLEGYAVKGNKKTKDRVILREMRQKPGEPFNSKIAKRSVQRVYNLGFFEDVNIKMNPGVAPNAVIMEVDVKEKRTGSFGVGAGYSSEDGIIGMISVSDTNFRGTGDAISLTLEVSGDSKDARGFVFSYRHPWMDKRETSGTLRIYNRTFSYNDYDREGDLIESFMRRYSGGEIILSRPVSEYSTNSIKLMNRDDSYVEHDDDGTDRSKPQYKKWRDDNFGLTRSITLSHVTDTRDNIYNPTEGHMASLSAEVASFGGDFSFQKYTVADQRYYRVGSNQVIAVRGEYGYGRGDLSEFNQYRIGGQSTLRGYRDAQFRGARMGLATVEYRFPVADKVQGALFTDCGSAWNSGLLPDSGEIFASYGVGVSLTTPLGPLRLDWGKGKYGGRVHFSVGGSF